MHNTLIFSSSILFTSILAKMHVIKVVQPFDSRYLQFLKEICMEVSELENTFGIPGCLIQPKSYRIWIMLLEYSLFKVIKKRARKIQHGKVHLQVIIIGKKLGNHWFIVYPLHGSSPWKMIIDAATVRRPRLFLTDVNLVLVRSEKELQRDVYFEPTEAFDCEASKLPKLRKLLKRMTETEDHRVKILSNSLTKTLEMCQCALDLALLCEGEFKSLLKIWTAYGYDMLRAGREFILTMSKLVKKTFHYTQENWDNRQNKTTNSNPLQQDWNQLQSAHLFTYLSVKQTELEKFLITSRKAWMGSKLSLELQLLRKIYLKRNGNLFG